MRITDIEIEAEDTQVAKFSLSNPKPTDRYLAKAVYGLDADELIPKHYGFGAGVDGLPYYRVGMKPREIVMRLVLNPLWDIGETYSEVRDDLYRAISRSRNGELKLVCRAGATNVAWIKGHITKFEVPLFNKDPELQITILCDDPFFRSETSFEYLDGDFDGTGYISLADDISTAPHGVDMCVTIDTQAATFTIQDDDPYNWQFKIEPDTDFLVNDKIFIVSEHGRKECYMDRSATFTQLMDKIVPGSKWPQVFPGDNQFYIPNRLSSGLTIDYVRYNSVFWGV